MRLFLGLVLLFAAASAELEREEGVIVGGMDNFDEILKTYPYVLVEFYAPWCGHCKSLAPEYAKAAQELASNEGVALVKVDATVEGDLAKEYGVRGYPTLKFYKGDRANAMEYGGGRKKDDIVNWLNKKSGPAAVVLESVDAAKELKDNNDVVVVGYFAEADSADFMKAADSFDDLPFALTKDADVAAELELEDGDIKLFKQFDEGMNKYAEGDIAEFVKENRLAYVTEFSDKTAPKIFGGDIKKHILMFAAKSASDFDQNHGDFTDAAKGFKGKVLFVFIDCDKSDNGRILEFFGLKEEECPAARMIEMGKSMSKFKSPEEDLTKAGFEAFVNGVLDGSIQRHLMSEEEPEDNTGPVTIITGKNFEGIAYNADKAVFVEFYAPWCGHCKQLDPIWNKLGEKFADNADIVIAKSDATANEFADVEVQGFPTLKYFPKGEGNKMVDYNGGRDFDSLAAFVENDGQEGAAEPEEDEEEDDEDEEIEEEEEEEAADVKDEL